MNTFLSLIFHFTPLKFYVQSIWRDEAFSYLLAKQNVLQIIQLTAKDFNPPLYYFLLHAWMNVFGSSEVALRTLSFLFFLATLYVIGIILIEIFKLTFRETLLYLLLFIMNPVLHYYAFEARMYSLFAFFATLSFYFLLKQDFKKYSITMLMGLYTHYFMFFTVIGHLFFIVVTDKHNLKKHIKMYVKIALLYLPWLVVMFINKPPFGKSFWIPPLDGQTLFNIPGLLFTGYEILLGYVYPYIWIVSLLITGIFIYFVYLSMRTPARFQSKMRRFDFLFISWIIVPLILILAISLFKPIFLPRYMIFITIGLLLWLTYVLCFIPKRIRYILLAFLLVCSLHYANVQVLYRNKEDLRKPLTEIKKIMNKNDVVFVTRQFNFHPAQYYINDEQVYLFNESYDKIPAFVGKVLIPENKVTNSLPVFPNKAFILKNDLSYSVQALY